MSASEKDAREPEAHRPADPHADPVADLPVSADQVRGGVKWELSELDAVRSPAPTSPTSGFVTKIGGSGS